MVFVRAVYNARVLHSQHQKLDHLNDSYFGVKQDFLFEEAVCYVANDGHHYLLHCFMGSD